MDFNNITTNYCHADYNPPPKNRKWMFVLG